MKHHVPNVKFPNVNPAKNLDTQKNYCRNNPRCVKYAAEHLTNECPRKVRDDNVKCVNCNEKHPANYRGCMVYKQVQQKIYPRLRERNLATWPIQSGVTYAQVVQGQTEIPQTDVTQLNPTNMTQPSNDVWRNSNKLCQAEWIKWAL
jgi:hypothetical protein